MLNKIILIKKNGCRNGSRQFEYVFIFLLGASLGNTSDIQALFQELESLSCDEDSAGEQDTMSVSSTPKPSLRPFFSSSRSLLDTTHNTSNTGKYIFLHCMFVKYFFIKSMRNKYLNVVIIIFKI